MDLFLKSAKNREKYLSTLNYYPQRLFSPS
jgi:hypothetical protein